MGILNPNLTLNTYGTIIKKNHNDYNKQTLTPSSHFLPLSLFPPPFLFTDEDKQQWEERFAKFPDFYEIGQIKKEHTDHLEKLLQEAEKAHGDEVKMDACGNRSCC